ncbi:MAG TPA: ATP-binding protein [Thermoanaerobaculia bacterium]|nr:ATP-binding protein [Thermoanaerobaculia bacterium]
MIARPSALARLRAALRRSPVVVLAGPRQCGKTTLARELVPPGSPSYFDLEDPVSLARLEEPSTALAPLRGLVVLDEVQRRPELFPYLRVLADRRPLPARFLVLGSASPALLRQASESLAGRVEVVGLGGFSLGEVGVERLTRHWLRGGFPRSFLARSAAESHTWRRQLIQTFLERDLPQLGVSVPATALLRFWTMLAHVHGGVWNAADPARSLGLSEPTVRRYLDLMTGLFLVRQLPPWHENLAKRQVKSPKVYVADPGILHALLGVKTEAELLSHPKCGASWEGYVLGEALRAVEPDEAYFWATHQGAELDLLAFRDGRRIGFEAKRADAPTLTPSMRIALADLGLDRLYVLYPGERRYELADRVTVLPAADVVGLGRDRLSRGGARR